ncbi:MAG: hypothetical protein WBL63_09170 [Candidatus Acidiferrum sp.]
MQETPPNPDIQERKLKASPVTIGMGVVAAVAILASLWFMFEPPPHRNATSQETVNLNMSPVEQEYVRSIEIQKIALSRAENFLHQEVTILNGEMYNGGTQPVLGLSLTTEFLDSMNQVVLRETRKVIGTPGAALAPGERRAFEISFEHVSSAWNMQPPAVRISNLQLSASKR